MFFFNTFLAQLIQTRYIIHFQFFCLCLANTEKLQMNNNNKFVLTEREKYKKKT